MSQQPDISSLFITPRKIKAIRFFYQLTQQKFADLLDISVRTLQNWEIGHRVPCGPATALLNIADKHPEIFLKKRAKVAKSKNIVSQIKRNKNLKWIFEN